MDDATVPPSSGEPGLADADGVSGPPSGVETDREGGEDANLLGGVDRDLRQRARALLAVPLDERAAAFGALNGDVAAALRAIEEV